MSFDTALRRLVQIHFCTRMARAGITPSLIMDVEEFRDLKGTAGATSSQRRAMLGRGMPLHCTLMT
jgi:hypothetical protein